MEPSGVLKTDGKFSNGKQASDGAWNLVVGSAPAVKV
jgi:hypothetical protein